MFITNVSAAERVKQLENELYERNQRTENAQLNLSRNKDALLESHIECERLREALQQEANEKRKLESTNSQLRDQIAAMELDHQTYKNQVQMREQELLDRIQLLLQERQNPSIAKDNIRALAQLSLIESQLNQHEQETAKAIAKIRSLR
jgi:chromosome segregation ATPase